MLPVIVRKCVVSKENVSELMVFKEDCCKNELSDITT